MLNLSHPDRWIESFGMTALEAMAYSTPCIVPEEGGIAELITSMCGFRVSYKQPEVISEAIKILFNDEYTYASYSFAAKQRSE